MAEFVRYSDEELDAFKEIINAKLDQAKEELKYYHDAITHQDLHGTDDTYSAFQGVEDSARHVEKERLHQMQERQQLYIDHLIKALRRIENKTYGICRSTGKLISKDRLTVVPHATLSIEAKLKRDK
jgi:RNA polymerase-binding transcription factor DksA